jgi:hypothetical protein
VEVRVRVSIPPRLERKLGDGYRSALREAFEAAGLAGMGAIRAYPPQRPEAVYRRTGTLARLTSWRSEPDRAVVTVGAPYAPYVFTGTGIYGPTGKPVTPRTAKALRFQVEGRTVFARWVRGMPPWPDHLKKAARAMVQAFTNHLQKALRA